MGIKDTNNNELVNFSTTASAVNEITIKNAATTAAPEISATGSDTDIDLKLTPKGAGNLVFDGIEFPNADGTSGQVLQTNGSGVLSFGTPSVASLSTASGSAPSFSARAWVNFNGTGTIAIREDGNVSSLTDNGTGLYTVNFTTAMPDANYSAINAVLHDPVNFNQPVLGTLAAGSCQVRNSPDANCSFADISLVCVAIFR